MTDRQSIPLSKAAHILTRQYVAVLYGRLSDLPVDRYLYVPVMIGQANPPLTQNCLARQLQLDKATIARMLHYLGENGLVVRSVNKSDKRSHLLSLTDSGSVVAHRVMQEVDRLNNELQQATGVDASAWLQQTALLQQALSAMPATDIHPSFKHILSNPST